MESPQSQEAAPRAHHPLFGVRSEIAPLEQVIVHTPGEEMSLVSPANRLELLFDDILFVEQAQEEHETMARLFQTVVGRKDAVLQVSDLLMETFGGEEARHEFVGEMVKRMPDLNVSAYADDLKRLSAEELTRFALTGQSPLALSAMPVPNLMFTRDLCAVVGDHVILSHAATPARARESIIIRTIMRHHPRFAEARGRLIELPPHAFFEGGDLLVVSDKIVLIGHSERTDLGGVMDVTRALFDRTSVEHVLMVNLPKERYCMHLDTVFTFASENECIAYPPLINARHDQVVQITTADTVDRKGRKRFSLEVWPDLQSPLEALLGHEMTFIQCGGDELVYQRREQWTDGANVFALAPGIIVGYGRNTRTYEELKKHGYEVEAAETFISEIEKGPLEQGRKVAIQLRGNELSRGRGGPRCMTLPLRRSAAA